MKARLFLCLTLDCVPNGTWTVQDISGVLQAHETLIADIQAANQQVRLFQANHAVVCQAMISTVPYDACRTHPCRNKLLSSSLRTGRFLSVNIQVRSLVCLVESSLGSENFNLT